jgi:hypothetical protein
MEDMTLCTSDSGEVFRRVWRRVMGDRPQESSLIELSEGDVTCAQLRALAQGRAAAVPAPEGEASPEITARLRGQVLASLEGWQAYRRLAQRAGGAAAQVLNHLAGEQHRQARRLSAAYFLLTGLRYWPGGQLAPPATPSYWGALRARHQAERQQELSFAPVQGMDAALTQLYQELAQGCQARQRQLRALLEQGAGR